MTLAVYIQKFARLNANKNRTQWTAVTTHRAPHKPLLLLSVLDLFAQGSITANLIELTPELGELFTLYWHSVDPPSQKGYLAYPFYYLKSEGFWHLRPRPGQEAALAAFRPNAGLAVLSAMILGASLDEALYTLLQTENGRSHLRHVLVTTYFAPQIQEALLRQTEINVAAYQYSQELLESARQQKVMRETDVADPVRDQGFRRAIVTVYDHRCAFCGIRMRTAEGHTAVEAAHIIPWAISHNDDLHNGMALCRLCHWTFDEGLLAVSPRYTLLTSPQLTNQHNLPGHLITLNKRPILGPDDQRLWPDRDALAWHHKEQFLRR